MPKLKTHKGTKRRFKVTGTGALRHFRTGRRHLLAGKPARTMRHRRRTDRVSEADAPHVRRLLPYSG